MRRAELNERLHYVVDDESVIMTSAAAAVCVSVVSVAAAAAAAVVEADPTDRILAAHCQSARVYRSMPVRPLIAASSAAAVAAGTTRPAPSISSVLPSPSPPYLLPLSRSRLLADSAVDSAPLAVCRLVYD